MKGIHSDFFKKKQQKIPEKISIKFSQIMGIFKKTQVGYYCEK